MASDCESTTGASERLVLINDNCNSIFLIPSHFVESYGERMPSKVGIRVDDSGKKWKVSVEKFKDQFFFTDGWKEFAEQVNLKSHNFLKLNLSASKGKTRKRSGDVNVTTSFVPNKNKDKCSGVGTRLSFTKEITKDYYLKKLYIPSKFVSDTGMQIPGEVKLKDCEGREWPIHLKETSSAGVPTLTSGWSAFVEDNTVMVGSKVSFTWLSGNVLQARIVRGELQDTGEGYAAEKIWRFCKNMKNHNQYCLEIPQDFARGMGLRKDEGLKLRNGEGREWAVGVIQRNKPGRFTMTRGWAGFVIDNKVMLGSKVSFTWLYGNTLQTEISEVGTDKQQLSSTTHMKRKCL